MSTALIIVDYQRDFLPGGPLGVPEGHQASVVLEKLAEDADIIVFTQDWHPGNHFSFKAKPEYKDGSWPVHCVQNTEGSEIDSRLLRKVRELKKPTLYVHKGMDPGVEAYSGFDGMVWLLERPENVEDYERVEGSSGLAEALHNLGVEDILVGGLALDYCVLNTARDAKVKYMYPTTVVLDATRAVSYLTGAEAIRDLVEAGVRIEASELRHA